MWETASYPAHQQHASFTYACSSFPRAAAAVCGPPPDSAFATSTTFNAGLLHRQVRNRVVPSDPCFFDLNTFFIVSELSVGLPQRDNAWSAAVELGFPVPRPPFGMRHLDSCRSR